VRFAGIPASILGEAVNTIAVSVIATLLTLTGGMAVVYAVRVGRGRLPAVLSRLASLGYALPGTVLALGLLPVITGLDRLLDHATLAVFGVSSGLFLLGSGAGLVYAYFVRFLTIAVGGVEAGLSRVSTSLDDAARTLGEKAGGRLRRIHIPLVRPAIASALLLVFVDCLKELPATLLLRPLGFETLATHLYGEAVRGTYEDAAIAALLIVIAGLAPVVVLARVGRAADLGGADS
jgi:iron(III) transport system permease protein